MKYGTPAPSRALCRSSKAVQAPLPLELEVDDRSAHVAAVQNKPYRLGVQVDGGVHFAGTSGCGRQLPHALEQVGRFVLAFVPRGVDAVVLLGAVSHSS